MEWLEKIRSPLIFRSLYYGFCKLAIKTNNSTPRLTASLSMAFTHLIQVLFLIDILRALKVINVFEATWAKTDTTNLTLWYTKKGKEWLTIDYYKWNKELEF
ncbi:hypothetical protein SAMN04488096_10730 [Mesonia phycicola]|uniref:Uncharacterized protein n=1 Tax=Mesonia phycicola TaxID=579105 RepID=A0A1M6FYP3_9FLAO|nr:hypothetical protein [Mesonia phycicola]SHJ02878.1 hypothetical protein SAMN04488096_10730 [Mesonia phycicola]